LRIYIFLTKLLVKIIDEDVLKLEKMYKHNKSKNVLLIGDLFLDEYIQGSVSGLSDNAPIPIVNAKSRTLYPSSAGYAASQMFNLGLNVHLCGVVGDDPSGTELLNFLKEKGIGTDFIIQEKGYITPKQTHISVKGEHYPNQDILKVNATRSEKLTDETDSKLLYCAVEDIKNADVIVFTDRTGTVVTPSLVKNIKSIANKNEIPLIGDSEFNVNLFSGFNAVTINEQEAARLLNKNSFDFERDQHNLKEELDCNRIFLTRGSQGTSVLEKNRPPINLPTEAIEVYDVSGAGESVLAAVTAGIVNDISPAGIGRLANLIAGLVVSKPGLTKVTMPEIINFEKKRAVQLDESKVMSIEKLTVVIDEAQDDGKKITWTNGCYDIMHIGHILYLERAKALGDILIVGLNSDKSVRKSKGANRPIVEENQRAKLLASLSFVDYVIIFDDETPADMIRALQPNIYAKGGDYSINTINQDERKLVESYGGEIAILPGVEGMSTSNIIEKILKVYKE
jgi:D-beta-D-heptose 7-phosphate kinase / D-beta-D-heptose 1-phosphate adenosyltransferase